MAWTSKVERSGAQALSLSTPQTLGPGAYHAAATSPSAQQSYAPFNTTRGKLEALKVETCPPPGAYDPQLPKGYNPSLPRKHVPFTCGADRSGPQSPNAKLPGPGQYHKSQQLRVEASRSMGVPHCSATAIHRSLSAPSIPVGAQSFGYEDSGDGRLVRQGPKDGRVYLSGNRDDMAGPGHYQSHQVWVQKPRPPGGRFGSGAARQLQAAAEAPGPGHYMPVQQPAPPVTSSFVSTSTSRAEPKRKRKIAATPGPGSYSQESLRRPSMREEHPELQYFGSTSERFKGNADRTQVSAPGPGAYASDASSKQQRPMHVKPTFSSGGDRFSQVGKAPDGPGPGAYDLSAYEQSNGVAATASLLGSTGRLAFGSMESKRGIGSSTGGCAPGPGEYKVPTVFEEDGFGPQDKAPPQGSPKQQVDQRRRTAKGVVKIRAPSSAFRSDTMRDQVTVQAIRDGNSRPPPGAYDPVHNQDLAAVIRLPPKSEGFLSSGARGNSMVSLKQVAAMPGPGMYARVDPADVTCGKKLGTFNRVAIEVAPATGKHKGLGFDSQTRRFKYHVGAQPGPGAYNVEPEWTKKNFNINFGEV